MSAVILSLTVYMMTALCMRDEYGGVLWKDRITERRSNMVARLSELYKIVGDYLELNGDKEIASIESWDQEADAGYTLNCRTAHYG